MTSMPLAVLELAKWTRHPDCARAETTALRCTCGLNEAWRAAEALFEHPTPRSSNDQKGPR